MHGNRRRAFGVAVCALTIMIGGQTAEADLGPWLRAWTAEMAAAATPIADAGAGYEESIETSILEEGMANAIVLRTPGTDLNLGMSWESTIAVSRVNPLRLAVVQGNTLRVSTDGGTIFQPAVNIANFLPATHTGNGDGVPAYDFQGRLFVSFLGNPLAGGGWDVFVSRHDPTDGSLISGPVNVGDQVGMITGMNIDKPWLAADSYLESPATNRLYLVWSVTGGNVSGTWEIYAATSNDQGATWTRSFRTGTVSGPLSPADASEGRAWAPHVAVAIDGDAYISFHGQPTFLASGTPDGMSGRIALMRSIDAGATYTPVKRPFEAGEADTTQNAQQNPETLGGARFWTIGNKQSFILPDPDDPCTLHVVTADDPDNDPSSGDGSDVMMATTDDCGLSFSTPQKVDDSPAGTWQVFPSAAIDPNSGAIAVTWLDNRDSASYPVGSAGNARIDLRLRTSSSSGVSWFPSLKVNDVPIDADASLSTIGAGVPPTYRIGEYNGVAFGECSARMVWAGDPVLGGNMDTYYDEDPEAGGDFDLPILACPRDAFVGCNDPTDPSRTGEATARDLCDRDPVVGFFDVSDGGSCPPTPVIDNITRTWTARDAAGNTTQCQQLISIQDFDPPTIFPPSDTVRFCDGDGGLPSSHPQIQGWLNAGSAIDACSATELVVSGVPDLFPVDCGAGVETFVTFSAIDACGNAGAEVASMRVTDPFFPLMVTPEAATLECSAPGGTPSTDPAAVAWLAEAAAVDNCGAATLSNDAPALFPAACGAGAATTVTFDAVDVCGNTTSMSEDLTVVDTKPPTVSASIQQLVFDQPDHEYRCVDDVRSLGTVADLCQSFPLDIAISCASSQCDDAPCPAFPGQDGDGSTVDDCFYDPLEDRLCARAERAETNPEGRTYTATMTATDACGNAGEGVLLEIFVPWGCAEGDADCVFRDRFESGDTAAWSLVVP